MLRPERNSTYVEVKSFLDDIYMHLCNARHNASTEEGNVEIEKLVERCEAITQLFEISYDTTPSTYLVMNSKKSQQPVSSEYVDVITSPPKIELKSLTKNDAVTPPTIDHHPDDAMQQCPFSGLPAAHLSIKQSPVYGYLSRIEKRMFFEQSKKYYVGLLDDWLLLYHGGSTDLRPSTCLHLQDCEIRECHTDDRKRLYTFDIVRDCNNKKHVFQANTQADMKKWIYILSKAAKSNNNAPTSHINVERKLPNLPEPIHYINASHDPECAEDIYEEPGAFYYCAEHKYNDDDNNSVDLDRGEEDDRIDDTYDNVSSCKIKIVDTPPVVPSKQQQQQLDHENMALIFEYDIPKSPPLPVQQATAETVDAAATINDDKFRDVKSKLATHLLTGISPDSKKPKYQPTPSYIINCAQDKATSPDGVEKKIKSDAANKSPVKDWFLNRLSKSTSKCKTKLHKNDPNEVAAVVAKPLLATSARNMNNKGERINKIINQLEANGHLPIISKCLNERRNTICDVDDSCNYEPIMASGK